MEDEYRPPKRGRKKTERGSVKKKRDRKPKSEEFPEDDIEYEGIYPEMDETDPAEQDIIEQMELKQELLELAGGEGEREGENPGRKRRRTKKTEV